LVIIFASDEQKGVMAKLFDSRFTTGDEKWQSVSHTANGQT